jgi:hypothetical protein
MKISRHSEILSEVIQSHQLALHNLGEQHKAALEKLTQHFKEMMDAQLVQKNQSEERWHKTLENLCNK